MELDILMPQKVQAKSVKFYAKVRDEGSYVLIDRNDKILSSLDESYVPSFFPGEHYGDYIDLEIELDTGKILNWKKPDPKDIVRIFSLNIGEESE